MKQLRKSTLATGLALAAGLGFAGQASAGIYAGSSLLIDDLAITFTPTSFPTSPNIGNFTFVATSTGSLIPGGGDTSSATCAGNVAALDDGSCGSGGAGTPVVYANNSAGTTTQGSGPAEVGIVRTPLINQPLDTVVFLGPAAGSNYASSDAIIDTATLVSAINGQFATTNTRQISEAEIATATQANGNTSLSSTTSFTYLFNTEGTGDVTFAFRADPYLLAQYNDATASSATATANTTLQFRISGTTVGGTQVRFEWNPTTLNNGVACASGNVLLVGGLGCQNEQVTQNLNQTVTAPGPLPNSQDAASVAAGFTSFNVTATGLSAGSYSLALVSTTSAEVSRRAVPEPATLVLFGSGLAMLGLFGRRSRKA